jgi:hypothetical protein
VITIKNEGHSRAERSCSMEPGPRYSPCALSNPAGTSSGGIHSPWTRQQHFISVRSLTTELLMHTVSQRKQRGEGPYRV